MVVKAAHHCMISRGVHKRGADLVTSRMLGVFRDQPDDPGRVSVAGQCGHDRVGVRMIGPYRLEGFAIASADGMIADETGVMPLSLQLDADRVYFEEALERVAAVVHGRHSQEIQPKTEPAAG